jgi:TM2 domain-containing membrane protein YozV
LVAFLLSAFGPGAGHFYVGHHWRGLAWLSIITAGSVTWTLFFTTSFQAATWLAIPPLVGTLLLIADGTRLGLREHLPSHRPLNKWWLHAAMIVFAQVLAPWGLSRLLNRQAGWMRQQDDAMTPTLLQGEHVVFQRAAGLPSRGDLTVLASGESGFLTAAIVRRFVAGPGQRVTIRRGLIEIDGAPWLQDFRADPLRGHSLYVEELTVPDDMIYVLSDRRLRGDPDQGLVEASRLLGRPAYVVLPGRLEEGDRIGWALR